jgi:hypothetical protein
MLHWTQVNNLVVTPQNTPEGDREAAVAEFIRTKGVTRCPTACVLPTQGLVAKADRAALEEHAVARDRIRRAKIAARYRSFWEAGLPVVEQG